MNGLHAAGRGISYVRKIAGYKRFWLRVRAEYRKYQVKTLSPVEQAYVNILSLAILRDGLGMPSGWLRVHCKQFSCKHPISILNFDTLTRFPTGVWVSHPHIAKQETIQPKLNSTTKHTLFGSVKVSKSKCYNIDLFQAILRSRWRYLRLPSKVSSVAIEGIFSDHWGREGHDTMTLTILEKSIIRKLIAFKGSEFPIIGFFNIIIVSWCHASNCIDLAILHAY